eukprot:gene2126-biopygen4931
MFPAPIAGPSAVLVTHGVPLRCFLMRWFDMSVAEHDTLGGSVPLGGVRGASRWSMERVEFGLARNVTFGRVPGGVGAKQWISKCASCWISWIWQNHRGWGRRPARRPGLPSGTSGRTGVRQGPDRQRSVVGGPWLPNQGALSFKTLIGGGAASEGTMGTNEENAAPKALSGRSIVTWITSSQAGDTKRRRPKCRDCFKRCVRPPRPPPRAAPPRPRSRSGRSPRSRRRRRQQRPLRPCRSRRGTSAGAAAAAWLRRRGGMYPYVRDATYASGIYNLHPALQDGPPGRRPPPAGEQQGCLEPPPQNEQNGTGRPGCHPAESPSESRHRDTPPRCGPASTSHLGGRAARGARRRRPAATAGRGTPPPPTPTAAGGRLRRPPQRRSRSQPRRATVRGDRNGNRRNACRPYRSC